MIENYIPMEDAIIRIKYHPDITKQEKEQYEEIIKGIYMTDKGREKIRKLVIKNQQRNQNK
jgi:hypothetical protein